jgi:hypothetical protein
MRVGSSVIPLTAVATIAIVTKPGNQRESDAV